MTRRLFVGCKKTHLFPDQLSTKSLEATMWLDILTETFSLRANHGGMRTYSAWAQRIAYRRDSTGRRTMQCTWRR
jgi:hypothetical protein